MQKEEINNMEKMTGRINGVIVGVIFIAVLLLLVVFIRRRRKQAQE